MIMKELINVSWNPATQGSGIIFTDFLASKNLQTFIKRDYAVVQNFNPVKFKTKNI